MSDAVRVVAVGAVTLSYGLGGALSLAVLMAGTQPMHAPIIRTLSRVWAWAVKALSVALRAFLRARVIRFARALGVTYLHTYPADRVTGRHYAGHGRVRGRPGRHRLA